jgi:hypothetical protein
MHPVRGLPKKLPRAGDQFAVELELPKRNKGTAQGNSVQRSIAKSITKRASTSSKKDGKRTAAAVLYLRYFNIRSHQKSWGKVTESG